MHIPDAIMRLQQGAGAQREDGLSQIPVGAGRGLLNKRLTRSGTTHRPRAGPGNPNRVRIQVGGGNRGGPPPNKVPHCTDFDHNPRSWGIFRRCNLQCLLADRAQNNTNQKTPTMTTGVCGPYCHSAGEQSQFLFLAALYGNQLTSCAEKAT